MMETFHFLRPLWLLALPVLGLLIWRLSLQRLRSRSWEGLCDPGLLPHILEGSPRPSSRHGGVPTLVGLGGVLAILALAGPAWDRQPQPTFSARMDLVLVLDLSRSMTAQDIRPNRLTRARHKIDDILQRRKEGRTALVVFAESAFTVTPLTRDSAAIRAQLAALEPDLMPTQGSRAAAGLEMAGELLKQSRTKAGEILLIADGVEPETEAAIQTLRKAGHRLSVLGVGTLAGAPIPNPGGGFIKDAMGTIVIPKLDEAALSNLAQQGGGRYARLSANDQDLNRLLSGMVRTALELQANAAHHLADTWQEEGVWLLFPLLILAALLFRRGLLFALPLLLLLTPASAGALTWPATWDDLWQRPDQQAMESMEAGTPVQAADRFENQEWKAAAHYQAKQYQQSLEALEGADHADAHYNRGNALARLGRYPEALNAYQEALKQAPNHADAKHNLELVKKAMPKPPESKQGEKSKQKKSGDKEKSDTKQGENKQSQGADRNEAQKGKERDNNESNQGQKEPQKQADTEKTQQDAHPENKEQKSKNQMADNQKSNNPKGEDPQNDQQPSRDQQGVQQQQAQPVTEQETSPDKPDPTEESPHNASAQTHADNRKKEAQLATEQWLRRIPDDPGGLLRRKFLHLHQQNMRQGTTIREGVQPW
ncbi:MAG: VWA domain-containing protein [Magnetococcales bacterium]|nr:VWA domain-containing protein [Magnetococcales bacterium]